MYFITYTICNQNKRPLHNSVCASHLEPSANDRVSHYHSEWKYVYGVNCTAKLFTKTITHIYLQPQQQQNVHHFHLKTTTIQDIQAQIANKQLIRDLAFILRCTVCCTNIFTVEIYRNNFHSVIYSLV